MGQFRLAVTGAGPLYYTVAGNMRRALLFCYWPTAIGRFIRRALGVGSCTQFQQ